MILTEYAQRYEIEKINKMNQKLFNMIFTMKDIAVYRLHLQVPEK